MRNFAKGRLGTGFLFFFFPRHISLRFPHLRAVSSAGRPAVTAASGALSDPRWLEYIDERTMGETSSTAGAPSNACAVMFAALHPRCAARDFLSLSGDGNRGRLFATTIAAFLPSPLWWCLLVCLRARSLHYGVEGNIVRDAAGSAVTWRPRTVIPEREKGGKMFVFPFLLTMKRCMML